MEIKEHECRSYCEICGRNLGPQLAATEAEIARLRKAALAYRDLCACYRVGKRPSEELFERIMLGKQALEASDG